MKQVPLHLLACAAVLVTATSASGQDAACNCNSGAGSYVGYQSCDWNSCHGSCSTGCHGHRNALSAGSFWTRPFLGNGPFCAGKAYPDRGWAPPVHMPVNYDRAWYAAYHPQAYYGQPGGGFVANYPVVYQPTDTTQLGYYYHNVPTWQSRPGMIPPAPNPANFHTRMCPTGCFGQGGAGNSCQSCQQQTVVHGPQYCSPDGAHIVRPASHRTAGLLGGFRLFE